MIKPSYEELSERSKYLLNENKRFKRIEKSLLESEEKYRTLTENIAVGIFRSTPAPKGDFLEVNPALVKILGFKRREDLLKTNVSDIYQKPKDRREFVQTITNSGYVRNKELHFKKKNGTPIIVSVTADAVRDRKGKVLYFDGIVEDITEQKKTEEDLRIQKTYYEELVQSAPEAIVLHNNCDIVISINKEFTKMFGYSLKEAVGKPINDLIGTKDLRENADFLSAKVLSGERVRFETKRRRKDGSLVDVSILGAPIVHDKKQMGVYAIYRDITERKKAEENLRIQRTFYEELIQSAPEAIILHDIHDIIISVNKEFTAMFGYSSEEAVGKPINELIASEDLRENADFLSAKVLSGKRVNFETKRRCKDGSLIDVSILGAPIFHDNLQMGVYAIYRDISEKKKAEEVRIRVREEARMAREIQTNLLPKSNPIIPGYDIAGINVPALNVGGDYFDFINLSEQQIALALGDVSGKGLPAALVMANLQATVRAQAFFNTEADDCLVKSNKLLFQSTDSKTFISLFYGILDFETHILCYANAGQNMPIMFSLDENPYSLKNRGVALGIKNDLSYRKVKVKLNPGDQLIIYSDGISEAMNSRMEEFGEEKLIEFVQKNKNLAAVQLIDKIISEVKSFFGKAPQHDDMTIIILKRNCPE
ncbi:PAS domain S-box protein [candidate division KSB1 bacterium]